MRKRGAIAAGVCLALVLAAAGGTAGWLRRERGKSYRVPVLMYHKLGAVQSAWWVWPEHFEAQMRMLREAGYRSVLPSDLAAHCRWGKPLPDRPVVITFDDGYLSTLEVAEPVLRKFGFRGVIYLMTGAVAESPETRGQVEGADGLSWPEIRAMVKRGTLTVGGHTRNHANLMAMQDPFPEIEACYRDIVSETGRRPDAFCYPFGQCRDTTQPAVARAGFTTAMACDDRVAEVGPGANLMRLPRVSVMGGPKSFVAERVANGAGGDGLAVSVAYTGPRMAVTPRVVWPGAGPDEGWGEEKSLRKHDEFQVAWPMDASRADGELRFEVWDKHRVLRLFESEV